ncbi:TPA: type V toxin-antitoxin system endoribonuclease antitoxin GhoS, partial [Escherichia coli]|nr:type V toxin-antitoxin system endoribonuclease antitoxin GhoS [Escherichia coli]
MKLEYKNNYDAYIISLDYPLQDFVVFLELKSLMYDMNFVSIVFDK